LGAIPSAMSAAIIFYKGLSSQTEPLCRFSSSLCTGCTCPQTTLRVLLVVFGILLVSAPVSQPWSGRPERFIRWHDYSVDAELLWRGTFCNFAIHNWMAAVDPSGRHRPYVVFMAVQGIIHATVMLFDNRISAARGQANGNWEHAFEISGFYLLGVLLLSLLLFAPPRLPPTSSGSIGGEDSAACNDNRSCGQEAGLLPGELRSIDSKDEFNASEFERDRMPTLVHNQ
jgi:hypothetical protein